MASSEGCPVRAETLTPLPPHQASTPALATQVKPTRGRQRLSRRPCPQADQSPGAAHLQPLPVAEQQRGGGGAARPPAQLVGKAKRRLSRQVGVHGEQVRTLSHLLPQDAGTPPSKHSIHSRQALGAGGHLHGTTGWRGEGWGQGSVPCCEGRCPQGVSVPQIEAGNPPAFGGTWYSEQASAESWSAWTDTRLACLHTPVRAKAPAPVSRTQAQGLSWQRAAPTPHPTHNHLAEEHGFHQAGVGLQHSAPQRLPCCTRHLHAGGGRQQSLGRPGVA